MKRGMRTFGEESALWKEGYDEAYEDFYSLFFDSDEEKEPTTVAEVVGMLEKILGDKKTMFGYLKTTNKQAIEAYYLLKKLPADLRNQVYLDRDQKTVALIEVMENNIPGSFMRTQEYGFQKGLSAESIKENPFIYELLMDKQTWNDIELLDLILSMIVQAGFGESILPMVETNRNPFNEAILIKNGFENGEYHSGENGSFEEYNDSGMRIVGNLLFRSGPRARRRGVAKNFLEKNDEATLLGLSLPILQKSMGGAISGITFDKHEKQPHKKFGKNFRLNKFNPEKSMVETPGTISFDFSNKEGYFFLNGYSLPMKSINVLFNDMVVRSDNAIINGFIGKFYWKGKEADHSSESSVLTISSLELNNLRMVSESTTFAIGKLCVNGIRISMNQPLGTVSSLPTFTVALEKSFLELSNAFQLILNSAFIGIDKYVEGMGAGALDSITEILSGYSSNADISVSFDSLEIDNLIQSDMGIIKKIQLGTVSTSFHYQDVTGYYNEKIAHIRGNALVQKRTLSAEEEDTIRYYQSQIDQEKRLIKELDEIDLLLKNDQTAKSKSELISRKKAIVSQLTAHYGLAIGGVSISGLDMKDYVVENRYYFERIGGGTSDQLSLDMVLKSGKLISNEVRLSLADITVPEFSLTLDDIFINLLNEEKNSFPVKHMARLTNILVNAKIDYDEKTGKMQQLKLSNLEADVELNNFEFYKIPFELTEEGDEKYNSGESKMFLLPKGTTLKLKGVKASNFIVTFLPDEKVSISGTFDDNGSYTHSAKASLESLLTHVADPKDENQVIEAALTAGVNGFGGEFGASVQSMSFETFDGKQLKFEADAPKLLLKMAEFMNITSTKDGNDISREEMGIRAFDLDENSMITIKADKISLLSQDGAVEELVFQLTNPEFSNVPLKDIKVEGFDAVSFFEKKNEFFLRKEDEDYKENYQLFVTEPAKKLQGIIKKNTQDVGLTFSGKANGILKVVKNTKDKTWTISLEGDNPELDLTDIILKYTHDWDKENIERTPRKQQKKEERKELSFDYLNKFKGDVSIKMFGESISMPVSSGGYIDFVPALNRIKNLIMTHLDQGQFGEIMSVVEESLAAVMYNDRDGVTAYTIRLLDGNFFELMKMPMNMLRELEFSSRMKGDKYQLVSSQGGEELAAIDLALARGNVRGSSVKLSALLEYQLNTYPERQVNQSKYDLIALIMRVFVTPTVNAAKKTLQSKTLMGWDEFAKKEYVFDRTEFIEQIDNLYKYSFTRGNVVEGMFFGGNSGFHKELVDLLLPAFIAGLMNTIREANISMTIQGDYGNYKAKDQKESSSMTFSLTDNMQPQLNIRSINVPPFTYEKDGMKFSSDGITFGSGHVIMPDATFNQIEMKISGGSIKAPKIVIPYKDKDKESDSKETK